MEEILKNIVSNEDIKVYIFFVGGIVFCAFVLLVISKSYKIGLKSYWGKEFILLEYKDYYFFLAKAAAYRRLLYFYTTISYGTRIIGVLTTFYMIYILMQSSIFSKSLLVLLALCEGINLLFPFQKYVDLFSECCIKMEECILQSSIKLKNDDDKSDIIKEAYNNLSITYIECEHLIHTQNKI